jgi:ureidoacrylate peracid hydrolase
MNLKKELRLEPRETAVVVIDLQNGCCSPKSLLAKVSKQDTSLIEEMVQRMPDFLDNMRRLGVEVIWVRSDYWSESVPKNVLEAETLVFGEFLDTSKKGTWGFDYFGPRPDQREIEFVKNHPSVFRNKKFDEYLNEKGIKTLIFVGVFTSRCVFCSIVGASERGYRSILVEDITANWVEKEYETKATFSIIHGMLGFVLDSKQVFKVTQTGYENKFKEKIL